MVGAADVAHRCDGGMGTVDAVISLYTRNARIKKTLRDAFEGHAVGGFGVHTPLWKDRPRSANYAVTMGQLNRDFEYFAARCMAMPVVLTDSALEYLVEKCKLAHEYGRNVVMIGADYRAPNKDGE